MAAERGWGPRRGVWGPIDGRDDVGEPRRAVSGGGGSLFGDFCCQTVPLGPRPGSGGLEGVRGPRGGLGGLGVLTQRGGAPGVTGIYTVTWVTRR